MYASSPTFANPYPAAGIDWIKAAYEALVEPMRSTWGSNYGAYVNYGALESEWSRACEGLTTIRTNSGSDPDEGRTEDVVLGNSVREIGDVEEEVRSDERVQEPPDDRRGLIFQSCDACEAVRFV